MADPLPTPTMIAEVEALGAALSAVARTHRDVSLAILEQAVLGAVRAALPGLLSAVLQATTRALQAPAAYWRQPCPRCGQRVGVEHWRPRTVQTVCGAITWERPW
jgi:hypothetical protein